MKKVRIRWASFPEGHDSAGVTVSVPNTILMI